MTSTDSVYKINVFFKTSLSAFLYRFVTTSKVLHCLGSSWIFIYLDVTNGDVLLSKAFLTTGYRLMLCCVVFLLLIYIEKYNKCIFVKSASVTLFNDC